MGVARALAADDAVIGVGSGIFRHRHPEVGANLHAPQDEIDAEALLSLHLPQAGAHIVFLAYALLGPLDGNPVITGEGVDPLVIFGGTLAQGVLGDGADTVYVAEEVHDVLRAREQRQMAADDDAVETVVYERQQAPKQPGE